MGQHVAHDSNDSKSASFAFRCCIGRDPTISISTSLLRLSPQSGLQATLHAPINARNRSNGTESLRISALSIARFTRESIAPVICARDAGSGTESRKRYLVA